MVRLLGNPLGFNSVMNDMCLCFADMVEIFVGSDGMETIF